MKIFTDLKAAPELIGRLRNGIAPHELLLPATGAASVLADVPTDPLMQEADIVLGQPRVDAVLSSPNLKWLQVSTAGYTRYDTAEFRAEMKVRGIPVSNSSHVYDDPCAEHVLAFMLANARQLPRALATRCPNGAPEWHALRSGSRLLQGQSLLIVGYGAIAERVIELLGPFRMNITAMRRTVREDVQFRIRREGDQAVVTLDLLSPDGQFRNGLAPRVALSGVPGLPALVTLRPAPISATNTTRTASTPATTRPPSSISSRWCSASLPSPPSASSAPAWSKPRCVV